MRVKLLVITTLFLFFRVSPVFAISPPIQTSPANNSQVSSSKLTWEAPAYPLYSNDPYRIQVDDDFDFSSVYRDYKTEKNYYKPVLTEGIWYWRIKAKDNNSTWSNWSDDWSFILTNTTPPPEPSPTQIPTPSPTPTPTPTSTPTPRPSPTPKPKPSSTPKTPAPTTNPTAYPSPLTTPTPKVTLSKSTLLLSPVKTKYLSIKRHPQAKFKPYG